MSHPSRVGAGALAASVLAGTLIVIHVPVATQSPPLWTPIDLGTLGGDTTTAPGSGASGRFVAGTSVTASGARHAFRWTAQDGLRDLGTLGGLESEVMFVTPGGLVVGRAQVASGDYHAFVSDGTTIEDLGTLGGTESVAYGANDAGVVVGASRTAGDARWAAFVYRDGKMTTPASWRVEDEDGVAQSEWTGEWSGDSAAIAVNGAGQVIGSVTHPDGQQRVFLYVDGLATVRGPSSTELYSDVPTAVNDSGTVAAYTTNVGAPEYANTWNGRGLGGPFSYPRAIDAAGQVAGESDTSEGARHAVVWRQDAVTDLNSLIPPDSGWVLQSASGIDASGQVVGYGTFNGQKRAFRLVPPPDPATSAATDQGPAQPRSGATTAGNVATRAEAEAVPTTSSGAATYNLRVVTDASPDLSDLDSFIASTTSLWPTDREKVWSLFYWSHILKRQTSPMVLHGYEVTDPVRSFNDYGFTMCSTISGINQALYGALGLRHQYWDICNHTVSAVEYDGMFHMVDSSMSNLVTRDDGVTLASVEEIAANSARLAKLRSLHATSPNGFLTGSDTGRNISPFTSPDGGVIPGYSGVFCADGLKRRDYYYNWDAGHRYVLNVRENESYTRYYRNLGDTAEYRVGSESVSNPDPNNRFDIETFNRFGVRGNGSWTFTPSLTASGYARALYRETSIAANAAGGIRPQAAGQLAEAIYKVDAANAMTSQQVRAVFSRTDAQASATLSVSVNQGQTWREVARLGTATGSAVPLNANLRDEVSGQTEALLRVQMTAASAASDALVLQSLRIDTITQVNAKALPRLNVGRNRLHVGAGDQSETMSLWPELRGDRWRQDAYASDNIASQAINVPRPWEGVVYAADASREGSLTYRMDAPGDLTRLVYGGRLNNRGTGAHIEFWHSFDGGSTWTMSYRLTNNAAPWDVIHYETVTNIPPGTRSVLFKYTVHSDGSAAGRPAIFSLRMEAQHRPAIGGARPVEVTVRWNEIRADRSRVARSHKQRVTTFPFEYDIDVGGVDHPVMESLRVNLDGAGDSAPLGYNDGVDVGGEKFRHRWRTDGTNLAAGRGYTFSRAPSGFQSSAGAANTTILTDGVVGSPQTGGTSYYWGQCWSASSPLTLTVDLGQAQPVAAARAHLFGYPGPDALTGENQDRVELLTSLDGVTYASQGFFDTWVRRKDVPINHMLLDDERATGWNFEHQLPSQLQARYVRYQVNSPRILCVSELQVLDRVDYSPFDLRVALPNAADTVTLTAPADGATVSGTTAVAAATTGGTIASVTFYASGTAIGTDASAPYSVNWDTTAAANGTYTLTAQATTAGGQVVTSASRTVTVQNNGNALSRSGWVATASNNSAAARNAIDGNAGTRWDTAAAQTNGQWFQVDMLAPRTFDRVVLDSSGSPGDYPRGYRISVSDTGTSWVDIASGTGSSAVLNVALASQTRRYVRITQTGSSGAWWSIHELLLYSAGAIPPAVPTPYLGTPVSLPGTVEAENFDNGGNGVAYSDTTTANQGGAYRPTEAVDIQGSAGNYNVGWIETGEWLLYSVNVTTTGAYRARLRVASSLATGTGQVSLTFGGLTSAVAGVPNTGSWSTYQEITLAGLSLTAGTQLMRVNAVRSGWNLNSIVIEPETGTPPTPPPSTPTPYLGTAVSLPGTVEAENFDNGGNGVAYSDTTAANLGGAYRPTEAVDLEGSAGKYNVGWIDTGEWLLYSVNVGTAGTYRARLRVASSAGAGQVSLTIGGVTSATVGVPGTGSWSTYRDITISGLSLAAGSQFLRVNSVHSGWNLDFIVIEPETALPVIEAESYQSASGIVNSGTYIGYVDGGDWARYAGVNFGSGVRSVDIRVAVAPTYAGKQIQFRLDSTTGPIIGTHTVLSTGGWSTYQTQTAVITGATGVHDLYLVFVGGDGVGNIDWFRFVP